MENVNPSDLRRAARKVAPEEVVDTVLRLATERGADKTVGPTDVARALGGPHPDGWGPLMPAIRRAAISLMKEGRVVVTRKGRPVDPDDFRGIYRIRLAEPGEGAGAGSSTSERPESQ
jgi:hypothetical protein